VGAAGEDDAPAVGRLDAGDDAQERALAAAVDADHAEALAFVHAEGDIGEERALGILLADGLNGEEVHGSYYTMGGWGAGCLDVWTVGRLDGWTVGRLDGWTFGRLDVWNTKNTKPRGRREREGRAKGANGWNTKRAKPRGRCEREGRAKGANGWNTKRAKPRGRCEHEGRAKGANGWNTKRAKPRGRCEHEGRAEDANGKPRECEQALRVE
jgi:hypothetical protein